MSDGIFLAVVVVASTTSSVTGVALTLSAANVEFSDGLVTAAQRMILDKMVVNGLHDRQRVIHHRNIFSQSCGKTSLKKLAHTVMKCETGSDFALEKS